MFLLKTVKALQRHLDEVRATGDAVGFVPTMGALHEGHSALIQHSIDEGLHTLVSIYVNPAQFNDSEDLQKYPRNVGRDVELLHNLGCHVLFLPGDAEIYPKNDMTPIDLDLGNLETTLEGAFRPGHFEGVVRVMERLLKIVEPDYLFMGQKDLQQLIVVRRLIQEMGLKVQLEGLPIVREITGLALSSRNERLTKSQREKAVVIYATLHDIQTNFINYPLAELRTLAKTRVRSAGLKMEYFEFVNGHTLEILQEHQDGEDDIFAVIAVWCGEVRLIDNMKMEP